MIIDLDKFFDADIRARLELRLAEVMSDIHAYGIRLHKDRRVLTGYAYGEFYDWDLYFENIFLSYYGISAYNRNGVEMFLDQQLECGFVSRTMGVAWLKPRHHFKPFLAQIALLGSRQSGDYRWLLGKYYERLKKYLDYWFWFCDFDKNGLCVWDGSDHSGMDNQARRCGYDGVMTVEGVDLNSYLVRELRAMVEIATETGRPDEAEDFRNKAEALSSLINTVLWDELDGFYYDRDERRNELVKIKSIAGLIPLWLGIVPEDRARRLVEEHILNPREFWLPYPLATWAKSEPDYYQERREGECTWMGATWIPTNYMVFHGLLKYGYTDAARELADKTFHLVLQESATREYYNGETGSGQGLNPFWGWSTLAYFMPQEALAYPLYYFAKFFHIYDTPYVVVLVFTVIQSAFGTYLLSSVFSTFPREIIEAAMMDGCNKLSLLWEIVAPLSLPTLSVLFVFFFIWTWNEFFLPLILLPSNTSQTVPLALAVNQGQYGMNVTAQSASGLLGILPCIIFFLIFQRTLTRGITAGGIK